MKKSLPVIIIVALVVGGLSFYGGMSYGSSQTAAPGQAGTRNFQRTGSSTFSGGRNGGGPQAGGLSTGQVIAKDDQSITVKSRDGSSKIILFSTSTEVMKAVQGMASDLAVGDQVTAMGTANADGSITAQTIQVRPTQQTNQ